MSTSITTAFIKQYESEAKNAYQQMKAKLRNAVRLHTGVKGMDDTFQKIGRGVAGKKTRHGKVPTMGLGHDTVTATLEDWFGADYIDDLDLLKVGHDERRAVRDAANGALGRKQDNLIITAMDGATESVAVGTSGLTKAKIMTAFEYLNDNDVPSDNRFAVVGAHQWNELMNIDEFANADFAGSALPWLKGVESRVWLGTTWMFHSGLPVADGTRTCFMWHKDSVGVAEAMDINAAIDWMPDYDSWLVKHKMSMGAVLIDAEGIVEILCDDDATIS